MADPRCVCTHPAVEHPEGRRGGQLIRTACNDPGCLCSRYQAKEAS